MRNNIFSKNFKQRGITLIELMVAVLIIILIATIAMVSLKNSRAKARDAKRVYDISQYAKAFQLYAQENEGTFPGSDGFLGSSHSDYTVNTQLRKYLANLPADPRDDGGTSYKDYYYYYTAQNVDCKDGETSFPTIHIQNIETSNSDYYRNPCDGEGVGEHYANIADFLTIIR